MVTVGVTVLLGVRVGVMLIVVEGVCVTVGVIVKDGVTEGVGEFEGSIIGAPNSANCTLVPLFQR